jgi:uncharacterized coiled-coil protein SlyX
VVSLEQRVAYLEGRAVEHASVLESIRDVNGSLVREMNRLNSRMDRLEIRMDGFDHKLDQRFGWLIGIQVATLLAMVASFVALAQLITR